MLSNDSQVVEINFVSEYTQTDSKQYVFNLTRNNIGYLLLEIISMKKTSLPCLSDLKIYSPVKRKIIDEVECIAAADCKSNYCAFYTNVGVKHVGHFVRLPFSNKMVFDWSV